MQKVLEVKNLKKRLGKREIIKDISFYIEEGVIFGFLGPNGSGKTTTIRMLVDLISMDSGSISIMGKDITKERETALSHVGAVVENPELYKYLTGYENLRQIARVRGIKEERIDEVVKLVGLEKRIKDKMKKYSLGMKQRLGLAAALLSKPKLLILDEPTNGLDPNGIKEFRTILQTLAREKNMSVFVSSHILGEVQHLCDVVAFIEDGQITAVETMENLQSSPTYLLETNKDELTLKTLQEIDLIVVKDEVEKGYIIELEEANFSKVLKELISRDIEVKAFDKHVKGLEERYLEVIKGGIH
ncbi:MAG TPA: ABC transporter ATP-binding protein [Clostridiales bacterium]|nr:ABC transporter ATP-binding protein [Clostridiales bacterium]